MSDFKPPAGISHAPAPWITHSESWLLTVTLGNKLPEGVYDRLEASSSFADPKEAGSFRGGLGMIMIVRYEKTPVGPYDELIMIPGVFAVPGKNKSLRRISRIYVSQRDTTWNGRYNWNIPKHLARFVFTTSSSPIPGTTHLQVYPPSELQDAKPFFSCSLTPFQYFPAFPFSTRWLPLSTTLAQPPLPSAPNAHNDAEAELLIGTESWKSMPINAWSPSTQACWIEVYGPDEGMELGAEGLEERKKEAVEWWPVDVKPWKVGIWLKRAEIEIPAPIEWKL